jgi:alkaline phosphatase
MLKLRTKPLWACLSAVLIVAALCFGAISAQAGSAKHIILIIGDGMNLEHEIAGSRYWTGTDTGLSFHGLPYQNYCSTWDVSTYNAYANNWDYRWKGDYSPNSFKANVGYDPGTGNTAPSPVQGTGDLQERYFLTSYLYGYKPAATDSASAATALYTGFKTDDGNIAWQPGDPAGGAIPTIGELMKQRLGASFGAVSTVQITHATPAALYAHNVNRNNYSPEKNKGDSFTPTIAEQLTTCGMDVAIGSGHPGWRSGYVPQAQLDAMKANDSYVVVERVEDTDGNASLAAAAAQAISEGKKLFGLYGGAGGDFENRVVSDTPGSPSIDRGSNENPTFAVMITAALDVLGTNPNGFFFMAEQGNLDWRNHGNDYKGMVGCVVDLHEGVAAAIAFVDQPGDNIDWSNTLLIVTSDHSNSYMRIKKTLGAGDLPPQEPVGQDEYGDVFDSNSYSGYVTYGTKQHTNELVTVYARGAGVDLFSKYEGAWYPGTSIIDNTHIAQVMKEAASVN